MALSISSVVFWFGFAYLLNLLIEGKLSSALAFGFFIILAGIVVMMRGLGYFGASLSQRRASGH
jgi:mannose/fructose/N-acetylgalactosamine-specific phosphotransferase system component IIC